MGEKEVDARRFSPERIADYKGLRRLSDKIPGVWCRKVTATKLLQNTGLLRIYKILILWNRILKRN